MCVSDEQKRNKLYTHNAQHCLVYIGLLSFSFATHTPTCTIRCEWNVFDQCCAVCVYTSLHFCSSHISLRVCHSLIHTHTGTLNDRRTKIIIFVFQYMQFIWFSIYIWCLCMVASLWEKDYNETERSPYYLHVLENKNYYLCSIIQHPWTTRFIRGVLGYLITCSSLKEAESVISNLFTYEVILELVRTHEKFSGLKQMMDDAEANTEVILDEAQKSKSKTFKSTSNYV